MVVHTYTYTIVVKLQAGTQDSSYQDTASPTQLLFEIRCNNTTVPTIWWIRQYPQPFPMYTAGHTHTHLDRFVHIYPVHRASGDILELRLRNDTSIVGFYTCCPSPSSSVTITYAHAIAHTTTSSAIPYFLPSVPTLGPACSVCILYY